MSQLAEALRSPDHRARLAALKGALDAEDRTAPDVVAGFLPAEANPKVRNAMALVLGKLGTKNHARSLVGLLRDADAGVRLRAVESITILKDSASYPALVALLVSETDPKVRDFCAHHLMRLGGEKLMQLFQHMLASDSSWQKEAAVLALALFNSPRVVPLLKGVHQKETGSVQEAAFRSLERLAAMGNEQAARAVEELSAQREPPRLDVDFTNLEEDTGDGPTFEDTYTGGKLPRIDTSVPLEDGEEAEDGPPVAAPVSAPPAQDTPVTRAVAAMTGENKSTSLSADGLKLPASALAGSGRTRRPGTSTSGSGVIPAPSREGLDSPAPANGATSGSGVVPRPADPGAKAPDAEAQKPGGSGAKRPRPVVNLDGVNRSAPAVPRPLESFEGGMAAPRRGEDAMKPCPFCGAEISVGARRCRHCNEVLADAATPSAGAGPGQIPFDLAFVAVLTWLLGAWEAHNQFTVGVAADAALGTIMGIMFIAEIVAAAGAFFGFAWGWYLWWPLAFFLFMNGASHGDPIWAGRSFLCLISLSRTTTRDFCNR